jgi:hypothetical protein
MALPRSSTRFRLARRLVACLLMEFIFGRFRVGTRGVGGRSGRDGGDQADRVGAAVGDGGREARAPVPVRRRPVSPREEQPVLVPHAPRVLRPRRQPLRRAQQALLSRQPVSTNRQAQSGP